MWEKTGRKLLSFEVSMKCPNCSSLEDRVLESRFLQQNEITRRRRECLACHFRFTSYERIEEQALMVIKKNGSKELFIRQKLIDGLVRAFVKRPFDYNQIEKLVSDIEVEIKDEKGLEIRSEDLGKRILQKLASIDTVAYIRFASVYRKFENIQQFIDEINEINETTKIKER